MKLHLALTCFAYLFFGVGMTVQVLGQDAGLSALLTMCIFIFCLLFFIVIVFTSMEKVKKVLYPQENIEEGK